MSNIKRVRWRDQPQEPVSISNVFAQYQPKLVLLPIMLEANLGFLSSIPVAFANDVSFATNAFNFPGVNGFISFGSDTTTPVNTYTILVVSQLLGFPTAFPSIAGFTTSAQRQSFIYSTNASFKDIAIGRFGAVNATSAKFAFSTSEPVLGTVRNIVVKRNGTDLTASYTAWANGQSLARSGGGGFAADPGGLSCLGQYSSANLVNDFQGNMYLFALFNSALPDEYCLRLSLNPWQLFAPIPAKMWDAPSGVLPPAFIPWWASQRSRTIGAGAGLN
jgi:hypothetical protein